ncbi:Dam family site-specific DNA-(adenine-N6)-methyltransferase [Turicibacter bilis]|uniref:Dam family site-specific DNA-(adenine-N6)-methyltransferase n=1 Tax=Turicibacter bilis TaxID=2735723 RepID=UPI001BB07AEF|nr:Dam family site-specific DNA-(adenine-N6)-methyltransferase [Turicibacter bilis]UUF10463.1 Dam family site-specific DNA-(adenine-N6)-methyltransferase [Turicibacter bilis]
MRYIGSKANLLANIEQLLNDNKIGNEQTFLDVFAGTNVVGDYFKKDYKIYSNDLLYFSFINAKAKIENNSNLKFEKLKLVGIESPLDYLQENAEKYINSGHVGYYESNYTPTGDAMYLTIENGKRIDYIRDKIDEWNINNLLSEKEYYYLIAVLIEAIPFVSNITGTYGAFLKHWDKRALNSLELLPIEVQNNNRMNKAFNEDANKLVEKLSVDIAYIDPPYNNRQYASNYHLLENIARNHKPILKGKTKIFDWTNLRSDYAMKRTALTAMSDLIDKIDATHIVVSYNNEGIISEGDLIDVMKKYSINGDVKVEKIPYRKYKSKKPSDTYDLYEMLLYIRKKECVKNEIPSIKPVLDKSHKWIGIKNQYIKSPLNYIGGKYKLLKQIIPLFPKEINTFVDLFSGGANVGINVKANYHIFNDMNDRINEMFRFFSTQDEEELINKIKNRINEYELSKTNEEGYLKFRRQYNNNPNPLDLYVLVSYSYNYQFRFNNSMEFNNPFGRNRSRFSENMEKNLRLFVQKLHSLNAVFVDNLFNEIDLSELSSGDFVYLDPPYLITTGNYNDGNRGFVNWGERQEKQMYDLMDNLTSQRVRFALSNVLEHKGRTNELLKTYIEKSNVMVHYLDYNYNNSSYNSKGTGSIEVLITNYNPETFEILPLMKKDFEKESV